MSALLWALASVMIARASRRLPALPLNLIRCAVSTSFFWALLPFYGGLRALAAVSPSAFGWLVLSVLGLLVLGDTLYFRSLDLAGVSWAMPVAGINPLWAVLLAALVLGEPLSWRLVGAAVLIVLGVTVVSRSEAGAHSPDRPSAKNKRAGLLLALAASLLWGVGQVALRPGSAGIEPVVANSVRQPLGLLLLLGLSARRGTWKQLRDLDRRSWLLIVAASLVGTGVGSLLFVTAIQMVGAGRSAVLTATAPVMAIPFSVLWLKERPTAWTVGGTLLTVLGIALIA